MPSYAITYGFSQKFPFPAKEAYEWCVDFKSDDWARMGKKGRRNITRVDGSTLILDDTVSQEGRTQTKTRLVKLYPELLMWTNTRLSKPSLYSQFIYRIIPEGKGRSRLEFTGAQIEESRKTMTQAEIKALAKKTEEQDSASWILLAKEMKKDLGT